MEQKANFYSDGLKLSAVLFEPDAPAPGKCPGVVLCQGMSGLKEYYRFPEIARCFAALGCVALIFDHRGFGESEGERGRLFPLEQVEDIRNALTFLESHPRVDGQRLALYGMSMGGGNVPYVAAVDERVCCAISVVGFGDGERWMRSLRRHWEWLEFRERIARDRQSRVSTGKSELVPGHEILIPDPTTVQARERIRRSIPHMADYQLSRFSLASAEKILEFKPVEVVDRIAPRAILFITAEKDAITPADGVHEMYRRAGEPKRLWCIPGIGHFGVYEEPYFGQVVGMASDWLREHLHLG